MVKESKHRIDKTIAKYDPFVNLIRAKYQQNRMKQKFTVPASQQYFVDINIAQFCSTFGLKYGQIGQFGDLVKQYVWKWSTLTDTELEALYRNWILKGFTETQFTAFLIFMDNKVIEIATLYQYCHFPKSYLLQTLEVRNVVFPVLSIDTYIDDLITVTIEKIFAYPTANDKLTLKPLSAGATKLEIEVCCNNIINSIPALFSNPIVTFTSYNFAPKFDKPFVQISEMDIFRTLQNPTVASNIQNLLTHGLNSEAVFFMWNAAPNLNYAVVAIFASQNVTPSLAKAVTNLSVYNSSPFLNISVAKTP
jgi:hypothetical protein